MSERPNRPPIVEEIDGDDLDLIQAHLDRELAEDEDASQRDEDMVPAPAPAPAPNQNAGPDDVEMPQLAEDSLNPNLSLDPPSDPAPRPMQAFCHACEENIPKETPPVARPDGSLECPKCKMNFVEMMEPDDEYLEEEEKEEKSEEGGGGGDPIQNGLMGFLRQLGFRDENINIQRQHVSGPNNPLAPPRGPPPEVQRVFHQVGRLFGAGGPGGQGGVPPPFAIFQHNGPVGGGGGRGGGAPPDFFGNLFQNVFRGFGGGGQANGSFGGQSLNFGDFGFGRGFNDILSRLQRQAGPAGPPPAAKSVVDSLKEVEITGDSDQKEAENYASCAVCKDEFAKGEKVIVFPCPNKHVYHTDCIKPWLKLHNSCPVCRHELKTDDDWYERMKEYRDKHSPRGSESSGNGGPPPPASGAAPNG